jgi:DNA-binding NarL/FixJ family response regulator
MIRVLVVGDIRMFREGLALHLARQPGIIVSDSAASRAELLEKIAGSKPDVVLLDMAMPESLDALRDVAQRASSTRVVALALPNVEPAVLACAEAGIAGYVPREGSLDDLVIAISNAAQGESIIPPRIAASLLRHLSALASEKSKMSSAGGLTVRELEIARLVAEGMSNKGIAGSLCIEISTVKNHVHRILEKLHAQHRAEIPRRLQAARSGAKDDWNQWFSKERS